MLFLKEKQPHSYSILTMCAICAAGLNSYLLFGLYPWQCTEPSSGSNTYVDFQLQRYIPRATADRENLNLVERRRYDTTRKCTHEVKAGLLGGHKSTPVKNKHILFPPGCSYPLINEALPGSWLVRYMRTDSP
jgi:hypothetical protein